MTQASPVRMHARAWPKGRAIDPAAQKRVTELVDGLPLRSDMLIEHLHRIQDAQGHLSNAHLVALADLLHLAPVEVFEVATFYHHFDVVGDGAPPPPPVTVRICTSLPCAMSGANGLDRSAVPARACTPCVDRTTCKGPPMPA